LYLTLVDVPDGRYRVSWFDPQQAHWLGEQSAETYNNILVIAVPAFREDLAARITPLH
jgi:hypothetical protein